LEVQILCSQTLQYWQVNLHKNPQDNPLNSFCI
jgi:hypothetical protein